MVSLGSNQGSPGAGFYFNTDLAASYEDDASLASSVLVSDCETRFKTFSIASWAVIIVHNVVILALFISAIIIYESFSSPCFYMHATHVGIWCLVFLTTCSLNYYHNIFKRYGYLEFHRKTRNLIKFPFLVLSFGNAAMLAISSILHKYCLENNACPVYSHMRCEEYTLLVFLVEFLFLPYLSIKYLIIVIKFCRDKNVPDVHHDEVLVNCLRYHSPSNEIGYRDGDFYEEMLERQADMIRYLKQHNVHLSKKILRLTVEMNARQLHIEA